MEKPKKYEDRLMEALAFDEGDVEANRAGYFSEAQKARLNRDRRSQALGEMFLLVLSLVGIVLVLGAVNLAYLTPPILAVLVGIGAFFLGLAALIWARSSRTRADLRENRVAEAEGRVDLVVNSGQYAANYFLRVGDIRFTVKQNAFLAFKNGDPYRIYYTPRSKRILSVEWLRENDDNLLEALPDSASIAEPDAVEAAFEPGRRDASAPG